MSRVPALVLDSLGTRRPEAGQSGEPVATTLPCKTNPLLRPPFAFGRRSLADAALRASYGISLLRSHVSARSMSVAVLPCAAVSPLESPPDAPHAQAGRCIAAERTPVRAEPRARAAVTLSIRFSRWRPRRGMSIRRPTSEGGVVKGDMGDMGLYQILRSRPVLGGVK